MSHNKDLVLTTERLPHNPVARRLRSGLDRNYNRKMARGWESKSVEAQQAEATDKSSKPRVKLTPEAATQRREQENLRLSRQNVVHQLEKTQNPRYRKLLEDTLADLDQKLNRFNS